MNNYTYLYHYNKGQVDNFLIRTKNQGFRYLPLEDVFCLMGLNTNLSFSEIASVISSAKLYSNYLDVNKIKESDPFFNLEKIHYIGEPIIGDYSKYFELDSLFELKYNLAKLVLDPQIKNMEPIFINEYTFENMGRVISPKIRKKTFTTFKKIDENNIRLI